MSELEAVAAGRATRQRSNRYRTRLGEPEVVLLGVDRLDYTKGISQRLRAYQSLLDDGTLDTERCVMVQVATPTREGVEHYQNERREIEQLVSEINGVHGRLGYPAIHYLYQSLPLDELVALYRTGDVMLVTPLRDGMNLVAKEYVTTRLDGDGVLVLSEFAGAADELLEAVLVNPHDNARAARRDRHRRRDEPPRAPGADGPAPRGRPGQRRADVGRPLPRRPRAPPIEDRVSAPTPEDPDAVAAAAAGLARPLLVGLDVDGVLAPIVAHADDAELLPGHARRGQRAGRIASRSPSCPGARSRTSSASGSPTHVEVFGLHGMERDGERTRRAGRPRAGAPRPAGGPGRRRPPSRPATGRGSSSSRPASCSTCARRRPRTAPARRPTLRERAEDVTGVHVLPGHGVVELLTRATSKARAIAELRDEIGAGAVVFAR